MAESLQKSSGEAFKFLSVAVKLS